MTMSAVGIHSFSAVSYQWPPQCHRHPTSQWAIMGQPGPGPAVVAIQCWEWSEVPGLQTRPNVNPFSFLSPSAWWVLDSVTVSVRSCQLHWSHSADIKMWACITWPTTTSATAACQQHQDRDQEILSVSLKDYFFSSCMQMWILCTYN